MISIIVPTFNRQDYIAETLKSLVEQTYNDWECIVVDDGSTDDTETEVQKYIKADSRFCFYKRPAKMHKGANSCRNFGFTISKGKYIKFLDSDDIITEECLEKQNAILNANPEIEVCLSYGRYFDNDTKELKELWSRNMDHSDYFFGHVTNQIRWQTADPLWRKSFFPEPPFQEGLMNSQEWLMHGLSFLKLKRNEIYNLKETFTLIRRGNERMSSIRTSFYYKNQRNARLLLLKKVLLVKPQLFSVQIQLLKQISVFTYWMLKRRNG
ncbi:glycosyltransferase [Epilithonimonas sp. JDS]|uniref:glycosyltransferase family 2 protein n=1 Tax=Epilithonimonas sp. JDS TaxID=2902797 RepID=UPI001E6482A9|nr:glycosyltransferase family 2 protein [Epilithonimonas sp. JDS]MCD9853818.1 glycosyltransferase [Epilithonimonas sp. JDS]